MRWVWVGDTSSLNSRSVQRRYGVPQSRFAPLGSVSDLLTYAEPGASTHLEPVAPSYLLYSNHIYQNIDLISICLWSGDGVGTFREGEVLLQRALATRA